MTSLTREQYIERINDDEDTTVELTPDIERIHKAINKAFDEAERAYRQKTVTVERYEA
jgi:predicted membrane GTPase involved in stress response